MHRPFHSAVLAGLFVMGWGGATAGPPAIDQVGDFKKAGYAYQGQPVVVILPRPLDARMDYRPQIHPADPDRSAYFVGARDASQAVQPILLRELANAGYRPRLGALREDAGADLGLRYEVTRAWTTQIMPGMWPTPGLYRATVSAHVEVFRGGLDCSVQSYFVKGEGPSAWSAFSRALDNMLARTIPELMKVLSRCGAPVADTE